jgi:hypothetical protein
LTTGRYLLVKGRSGLGNRMLGAASALLYAQITGRRAVIDWRDGFYADRGTEAFERLFDSPETGSLGDLPDTPSVHPVAWEGRLDWRLDDLDKELALGSKARSWRATCVDPTRADISHDVVVMWAWKSLIEWMRPIMEPETARTPAVELHRQLLRRHFRPRAEIEERVAAFRAAHLGARSVGVHVRYSDRRSRVDSIERRLERVLLAEPGLGVFIATDNREMRDRFERDWSAVSTPHWYPEPGSVIHYNKLRPDRLETAAEALVDLRLLAGCDHLVGDGISSFIKVAALQSKGKLHDVQPLRERWREPIEMTWGRVARGRGGRLAVAAARPWRR